jgi:hypothetical protein
VHHPSGSTAIAVVPVATITPSASKAAANLIIVISLLDVVVIDPQSVNQNFDQSQKGPSKSSIVANIAKLTELFTEGFARGQQPARALLAKHSPAMLLVHLVGDTRASLANGAFGRRSATREWTLHH